MPKVRGLGFLKQRLEKTSPRIELKCGDGRGLDTEMWSDWGRVRAGSSSTMVARLNKFKAVMRRDRRRTFSKTPHAHLSK
jgi:hypothetical protein